MIDVYKLAEDYAATSLYQHMRAELAALIGEANATDTNDPYSVMKLRGYVEAYQRILSGPFLIAVAQRAVLAENRPAPAAPPMDPADWREHLLAEMGVTATEPVGNA